MAATPIELHRLDLAYADLRVAEKRQVARMAADIAAAGLRQPVLVIPRHDRFALIDGYCRVAALRTLGRDTVLAVALPLSERDALLFAYRSHVGRRRSALEDAWLLRELVEHYDLAQVELAERVGRSPSFVSRRLSLTRVLSETVQAAVRDGSLPAHAATVVLVPMTRVNADHVERLVANLRPLRPTSRQVVALYTAWCAADLETRQRIVDHPALFLKTAEVEPEPPAPKPIEALLRAIETVAGACHGARKVLSRSALHQLDEGGRRSLNRAFRESELAFAAVRERLAEEGLDAR